MTTTITFPDPEAEKLSVALGISKERHAQIVEALGRAYESEPDVFKVSSLIKNTLDLANITSANEVLYLGILIGKNGINNNHRSLFRFVQIHNPFSK